MKKIVFILLLIFSCEEKKTEFMQSKVMPYIFLIKNPPKNDTLLKIELTNFLMNNKKNETILFYKYTSNSVCFLEHLPDPGGFSSYDFKEEEEIAKFQVSKCKNDTTKLVGELRFYNSTRYDFYKPDTIIYNCK